MKKALKIAYILSILPLLLITIMTTPVTLSANAADQTITLSSTLTESGKKYDSSDDCVVETMKNGKKNLTSITLAGDITDESIKDGVVAYGLNGNNVSFDISYDDSLLDDDDPEKWHIYSDESTSVNGYKLGASVNKGCLIILKKQRGGEYELATNPITNFKSSKEDFYTPSGEDVYEGTYYKIIFAYSSQRMTDDGFLIFGKEYDTYYHMETYEFYLCENSARLSVHNLSTTDEQLKNDEVDIDLMKKGETLSDGSTTTDGFKIDKLNITGNTVSIKHNGVSVSNVEDGKEFTETGKYEITTVTRLGKQSSLIVYVINENDRGYATYFGDSILHANRVFRFGDYPTYGKGAYVEIKEISENTPILYGSITNTDTGEVVFETNKTREAQRFDLKPANYHIEFYSGDNEAVGSIYKYSFKFEVLDEKSAPYVNYYNLTHTDRLEDLQSKHYEVAYQTTLGGYIFVCFSLDSYSEALEYAYEIEKRFIEKNEDGLYYKSIENPSLKIKYIDGMELTSALNYYAKKNVEINYFNPLDEFTFRTYDNDLLTSLESLNLTESIKVFPSQEEKDKLIKRKPLLNNYEFINVEEYDEISVTAYCEKNSKTYNIEFNKPIEEQLSVSSKYTITETNVYGDSVSYDVYYINENQTISHWVATTDGTESIIDISARDIQNGKMEITADSLVLKDITNILDENAIVTIKAPDIYAYEVKCLISEMEGFTLYEPGTYELTFVDIMGNYYQFIVTINGAQWSDILAENTVSYTGLYNTVHLNSKDANTEELVYNSSAFSQTMSSIPKIDYMLYTSETITPLVEKYNYALSVSSNNPTQKEINALNKELIQLKNQLVLRENKQELFTVLHDFEKLEFDSVSKKKANKYQKIYNNACEVLNNINATDDEISTAINDILDLKEELLNPSLSWWCYLLIVIGSVTVISGGVIFFLYMRRRKNCEKN